MISGISSPFPFYSATLLKTGLVQESTPVAEAQSPPAWMAAAAPVGKIIGANRFVSAGACLPPPKAKALAAFLRRIIDKNFFGEVSALCEVSRVPERDVKDLLRGKFRLPGDRKGGGFRATPHVYHALEKTVVRAGRLKQREYVERVRAACMEAMGWEKQAAWFSEGGLGPLFKQIRLQELLGRTSYQFVAPEDMDARGRLIYRVIRWWVDYNLGMLTPEFHHAEELHSLLGIGTDLFRRIAIDGNPSTLDVEATRRLAAKLGDPHGFYQDWLTFRKDSVKAQFLSALKRKKMFRSPEKKAAAVAIFEYVAAAWAEYNGCHHSVALGAQAMQVFGVCKNAVIDIGHGLFPPREFTMRGLAMKLEGLKEEDLDEKSVIMRHWRLLRGKPERARR